MYHLGLLVARAVGFWGLETKNWVQSTSSHVSRYCSFIFFHNNLWSFYEQVTPGATVLWKVACKVMPVDVTLPRSKVHQWDSATRLLLSPSPPYPLPFDWNVWHTHARTHNLPLMHVQTCAHPHTFSHPRVCMHGIYFVRRGCMPGTFLICWAFEDNILWQWLEMQTLGWGYSATWWQTFRKTGKSSIWLLVCFVFRSTVAVTWGTALVKR